MNKQDFWSQLITLLWQIIAPLVFVGGSTGLLALFRESLPNTLYNISLYVIWFSLVSILIWLVLRLILGELASKSIKQIREFRQRRYRRKLARSLFDKWFKLSELVVAIIKKKNRQPTTVQSQKYFDLHLWFIANRPRFLPEWHSYDFHRTDSAHDSDYWDSTDDLGYKVFREYHRDPFSYFYEPLNANFLMHHLIGESPGGVRFVLDKLTELTLEFVKWIDR